MGHDDTDVRECSFMMVIASPRMVAVEIVVRTGPGGGWSIICPETGAKCSGVADPSGHDLDNPATMLLALGDSALAIGKRQNG